MKKILILFCILPFINAYTQSPVSEVISTCGNSSTHSDLMIEWTVGEIMVEAYTNGSLQLTQGLHQGYSAIQSDVVLFNQTISSGQNECFSALQTIITENFTVEQGSSVILIAGHKINLLNGTIVQHGGNLLAYITTTGSFCENPRSLLTVNTENTVADENDLPDSNNRKALSDIDNTIHVYPNPNTGQFFIKINNQDRSYPILIEIFGMLGEKVCQHEVMETDNLLIDISQQVKGFYIIRMNNGKRTWVEKISKL